MSNREAFLQAIPSGIPICQQRLKQLADEKSLGNPNRGEQWIGMIRML